MSKILSLLMQSIRRENFHERKNRETFSRIVLLFTRLLHSYTIARQLYHSYSEFCSIRNCKNMILMDQ